MKLLFATIRKEFFQLVRNKILMFLLLVCPLIVLGIIPLSFDGGYRIRAGICDASSDLESVDIAKRLSESAMFEEIFYYENLTSAERAMERGEIDMILLLSNNGHSIILDGTFPRRAMSSVYATSLEAFDNNDTQIVFQILFNAGRSHKHFYLVSLIILVITILGTALITLNIVNERESGVEEQFKATSMNRSIYLFGKFIFYTLLCLFLFFISYLFCYFVYNLQIEGSLFALFIVSLFFTFLLLGLGFLIALLSNTQLRAVYILTITLVLMIMLSTMFTHLSSMPYWAAVTRFANPVWYGVESARLVVLMGATLEEIAKNLLLLQQI
ncbi:MAG: ABC transporter permease [Bacteroidales bacterium]|jgi:ABC-2 type transport system permease protein|nr:ABC transporter permease [Bacteroidales bacterium]